MGGSSSSFGDSRSKRSLKNEGGRTRNATSRIGLGFGGSWIFGRRPSYSRRSPETSSPPAG